MTDDSKDIDPAFLDEIIPRVKHPEPEVTNEAGVVIKLPRRFFLERVVDKSGVSGTGVVAAGIEFADGSVALRWLTATPATGVYASVDDVRLIHGHGGDTLIVYVDREF